MNIVSFGGGTNSAALLIGLYKHKIPIDLITFADTGAEHPHTYQFIEIINQWLAEHGMPQITVVQYVDRYGNRLSLETECYPLIEEWGWNRDDCIREIKAAGLPQPGKSSCFFCPSMKKQEILYLKEHYPDLFTRAATLEENAMPYLKTVKGLGRSYSWKEQFGKE